MKTKEIYKTVEKTLIEQLREIRYRISLDIKDLWYLKTFNFNIQPSYCQQKTMVLEL